VTKINSKYTTPPFLVTFEMFKYNDNYLVDSGASTNVMPWYVCQNISAKPEKTYAKIIQLYRSQVQVVEELNNVLIKLSSNSRVHQCINIALVDIPEEYGLILSRD